MTDYTHLRKLAEAVPKDSRIAAFGGSALNYAEAIFLSAITPAVVIALLDEIERLKSQVDSTGWYC